MSEEAFEVLDDPGKEMFFIRYGFDARSSKYTSQIDWFQIENQDPEIHLAKIREIFAAATSRSKRKGATETSNSKSKKAKNGDISARSNGTNPTKNKSISDTSKVNESVIVIGDDNAPVQTGSHERFPRPALELENTGSLTSTSPRKSPRKSPSKKHVGSPSKSSPSKPRTRQTAIAEHHVGGLDDVIVVEDDGLHSIEHGNMKGSRSTTDLVQADILSQTVSNSIEHNEDLETTAAAFVAAQHHALPSQNHFLPHDANYFESSSMPTGYEQLNSQNVIDMSLLHSQAQDVNLNMNQISTTPSVTAAYEAAIQMKRKREASMLKAASRRIVVKAPVMTYRLPKRSFLNSQRNSDPNNLSRDYSNARALLHVSAVPDALPCRDREFSHLFIALEGAIKNNTGSCLYVSGTPGTGKTATVREVLAQLQLRINDNTPNALPLFTTLEINGMKLINPQESYEVLWQHITGQRVSAQNAVGLLEKEFKTDREDINLKNARARKSIKHVKTGGGRIRAEDLFHEAIAYPRGSGNPGSSIGDNGFNSISASASNRPTVVVIMDELDQLVTKNQNIVYNFFNWPSLPHSKLIVIAIANTMDLPERAFSNKIASRLGLTRFIFPGYSYEQLQDIITSRLGKYLNLIQKEAIEFAARKVASVSGDARRALDICRRAFEIAENDTEPDNSSARRLENGNEDSDPLKSDSAPKRVVKIKHVKQAIDETTNSPMVIYLQGLPLAAKIFLSAVLARIRRKGVNDNSMSDILEETQRLCKVSPQADKLMDILYKAPGGSGGTSGSSNTGGNTNGSNSSGGNQSITTLGDGRRIRMAGFLNAVSELAETGIIVQQAIKGERNARVRLTIGEDEIKTAFKGDRDVESMI